MLFLDTPAHGESFFAQVAKSVARLFYWASYADKFGGTVQETQIYGTGKRDLKEDINFEYTVADSAVYKGTPRRSLTFFSTCSYQDS